MAWFDFSRASRLTAVAAAAALTLGMSNAPDQVQPS
jgi:hypothetical protein